MPTTNLPSRNFRWPTGPAGVHSLVASGAVIATGYLFKGTDFGVLVGMLTLVGLGAGLAAIIGRTDRILRSLLLFALATRLAFMLLDQSMSLVPKLDAGGYHLHAASLAEDWSRGDWHVMEATPGVTAYTSLVAFLYYLFGAAEILARCMSAVLGMLTVGCVFGITKKLFDYRAAVGASAAYMVLPSAVMFQSEQLRDPVVHFILGTMMLALVTQGLTKVWAWLVYLPAFFALFWLRVETFFVALVPFVVVLVVAAARSRWLFPRVPAFPPWFRALRHVPSIALAVSVITAVWAFVLPAVAKYSTRLTPPLLSHRRRLLAEGGSAYLTDVRFNSWLDVAWFLPIGAFYFLFTPFPWQIHNALALAAFVENVAMFYPIVVLAAPAMGKPTRTRYHLALLIFLLVGALIYGLVEANVGTAQRHRAQFTWVFFVFAGPALGGKLVPKLQAMWPAVERALDRVHARALFGA